MKRMMIGLAAAGLMAGGLALETQGEHHGAADDAAMHDCPLHGPQGMHREGPKDGPGMMGGWGMMYGPRMLLGRMGDELKLTDEQRTKIKGLFDAAKPEMEKLREEMRSNGERLAKTAPDDRTYAETVAAASRRIGELTTRMIQQGSDLRAKVHATLTPEQRTRMAAMKTKMMERMKERREGHDAHQHESAPPDAKPPGRPEAT